MYGLIGSFKAAATALSKATTWILRMPRRRCHFGSTNSESMATHGSGFAVLAERRDQRHGLGDDGLDRRQLSEALCAAASVQTSVTQMVSSSAGSSATT